ncbi:MAG: hypothetical protein J6J60_00640 [Clostridia bacterium]|nr:hypothetical protein [Clostridia bacterium]
MGKERNSNGTFKEEDNSIYIGKKYGKLTILEVYRYGKYNFRKCKCLCECGNVKEVDLTNLKQGFTKSCGCIRKNEVYDILVGERFGKLIVVEELTKTKLSQSRYRCLCDCGNYIEVYGVNLIYNQTKSCGCIHDVSCYGEKPFSTNKSGIRGVYYSNAHKKWVAKLTINRKNYRKEFDLFDDAVEYRKKLEEKYHKPLRKKYNELKKL